MVKTAGMVLFTLWVVEGLGRRKALIYGAILACLPLFYVGGFCKVADPAAHAVEGVVQQSGAGYFAMVCIYLNAFIICATWQGTTWTYASEIFPLDIRMFCVALTTASTWLGSFVVSRATPYMITDLGYGTFFMFGAFVVLMGIWAFFCVPETKGWSSILSFRNVTRVMERADKLILQVLLLRKWILCSHGLRMLRCGGSLEESL